MALGSTWYELGMGRAFIRACLWKMKEYIYIYRGLLNLFSSLDMFGPLKIFYDQKVANIYWEERGYPRECAYKKNAKIYQYLGIEIIQ